MDGNIKPHQIRMRSALDLMDLCLGSLERTKIFCGVPLLALDQIQVGVKSPTQDGNWVRSAQKLWTRNPWDYENSLDKTFTEKLRLQPTSITVRKAPGDTSRAGKFYSAKDEDG